MIALLGLFAFLAFSGDPEWHANLEQAFARAAQTQRPLLIVFR
jgi:hypothetical protein